ncbi:spermidine/putrescine ABC transporter substrate-binding protein [Salinisphaera sp. USBA-960]|nr:spermidine/putrescine ABC transporter substrate-binding protein [Salifodinibacter halophilus]NNC26324.1 spermidine/putrescine ABC transporter substrate-binding protein [Salifodinibacter halophilus]
MKLRRAVWLMLCLIGLVLASGTVFAQSAKKLFLFNWSQYMDPAIIKAFEKKYDVEVVRSFYDSNPQLFAKLRSGGASQYDVIFPSNYYVPRLIKTNLIQPLNHDEIPNLDNLKSRFRDPPYDPQDRYSVPYQWGTTGIAYNADDLADVPKSWSILFDRGVNPDNPFALIPDGQVTVAAACAYLGIGWRCKGEKSWKKAAQLLIKTKTRSNFNGFVSGTPILQQLARGNADAGMTFNGDYMFYKKRNPEAFSDIEYFIPKEGGELWVDAMAIPVNAPHPKLAHKFINFILKAKVGAQLSNWNAYATPNEISQPMLKKSLQKPPITPTQNQMKRLRFTPSLKGENLHMFQQLWTDIKSR